MKTLLVTLVATLPLLFGGCVVVDKGAETAGEAIEGVGEVAGETGRFVERELAN